MRSLRSEMRWLGCLIIFISCGAFAQEEEQEIQQVEAVQEVQAAPAFGERIANSPFVELYVLDELKQLRTDMAAQKNELIQQIVDREIGSIDRGVEYATDAITYFFYLIAAATSVFVLVGWTSIRDIKERVHSFADQEISKLIETYEGRLHGVEKQLNQKTDLIEENREEIALTQEVHSLWLRAGQDVSPHNKIAIYDQILLLQPMDIEALTYKAGSALELEEPQWAINLCHQALAVDENNVHAFYQLACAYTAMNQFEDAVQCLAEVLKRTDTYSGELATDPALKLLNGYPPFSELLGTPTNKT